MSITVPGAVFASAALSSAAVPSSSPGGQLPTVPYCGGPGGGGGGGGGCLVTMPVPDLCSSTLAIGSAETWSSDAVVETTSATSAEVFGGSRPTKVSTTVPASDAMA